MKIILTNNETQYQLRFDKAVSISIALDFAGKQPNHFGVPLANKKTYEANGFIGDTSRDGSCNVTTINTTPHCNGTHTETVHHIVDQQVLINEVIPKRPLIAALVTVKPKPSKGIGQSYRPDLKETDTVITSTMLERAFAVSSGKTNSSDKLPLDALIVRTLPNENNKRYFYYGDDRQPAFFTIEAIDWIIEKGFDHLLVDMPSVDKMYDEGKLTCHHRFWNVPESSHSLTELSWTHKTITEMVYVSNEIMDGIYGLVIHVPNFCLDAAPSNPILLPLEKV